jgi:hypothetical protein
MPAGCPFAERCSLAEERCRTAEPPNVAVAPGHFARCVLAQALPVDALPADALPADALQTAVA